MVEPEYGFPAGQVTRLYEEARRRLFTRVSMLAPEGVTEPREIRDLTPNLTAEAAEDLEIRFVATCRKGGETPHWMWVLRRPSLTAIGYYDLWIGLMLVPAKELT